MNQRTPEQQAVIDGLSQVLTATRKEHKAAAELARPALARLCKVMQGRGGQSYKLRALLYSLWNGKAASLVEVVCFDFTVRPHLCAVIMGFGYQGDEAAFFYDELQAAIHEAGLEFWFLEERLNTPE